MIGQAATIGTYFDNKSSNLTDTMGDFASHGYLYQKIADDFSARQKQEPSRDTAERTTIKGITIVSTATKKGGKIS